MSLDEFIIAVYCLIDGELKKIIDSNHLKLRSRGFAPALSDAEVLTMELVAEFQGIDTDKGAWEYFNYHWKQWFPRLGSRANYTKQASNLWQAKQLLQQGLSKDLGGLSDSLHMCDGFPMKACQFKRAYFSEIFRGEASYGYCASKAETYYGFKGNVMINSEGVISGYTITAANIDERESLWDMVGGINGLLIADKGLIGAEYRKELQHSTNINLQTAVRSNMHEKRSNESIRWLVSTRRLIETVIGQLTERFNIEKIRARKLWYLTNRIARKILAHTVSIVLNKKVGNPPLQFDLLITQS